MLHNDQLEVDFGDAPILTQIAVLIYRSWRQFYRSPSNLAGKLVTIFLIPFIMSSLYFDIADRAPASIIDEPKQLREFLQDFTSFIFMSTYFVFAMAVYDSVLICTALMI